MDTNNHVSDVQKKIKPVEPKVNELIASTKSVILATNDADGLPTASYAPYTRINNTFYILVSFMAKHAKNLQNEKPVSVMFIEDESATKQIYARERLTLDVTTQTIERDSESWTTVILKLKEEHGKVVDIISEMQDFILIALTPVKGSYVNGFGSAYFVNEQLEIVQHRNDIAHETK